MELFLIRKVKKFVKQNRIQATEDYRKDFYNHKFTEKEVKETLKGGIHLENKELYPNPERYASKFYVIHKIFLRHILIGYDIYKDHITLIHTNPAGNWEITQYTKEKKLLKKRIIGLFL